jgi:hypothetical protein
MANVEFTAGNGDGGKYGQRYDADITGPHKTQESRDMHPRDQRLRDRGFKIVLRPKTGPAIWERDGVEYSEAEAHKIAHKEPARNESKPATKSKK